ncbi:MAG: GNAT family N-acetyltransferase [Eubacteriales bacterium]
MVEYRICEAGDAPWLRQLWQLVFGDSDSFLDYYFANRFVPSHSVCTVVDGEIVGAIFGLPCAMNVRGVAVKASMSSGFCTHPDHRGKGYFSNLYALYLKVLRENAGVLAPNTPVYHDAYFRFETRTVSKSRYVSGICPPMLSKRCQLLDGDVYSGDLLACYDRNITKYSASIVRSYADFKLRIFDYFSDGAQVLGILEGGQVKAYAVFFETDAKLLAVEFVADDEDLAKILLWGLAGHARGREFMVKMPPDYDVTISGLAEQIAPQGVCALVNAPRLLELVGGGLDIKCAIQDPIVPENNGTFNFSGETVQDAPDFETTSGYLLQALVGYESFSVLHQNGHITCENPGILPVLERKFQQKDCFVVEEY